MFKTHTLLYKIIGGLLLIIGLTFSIGGFILTHSQPIVSTKVGSSIHNGNESLIFKNASCYKNSDLLEVELVYDGNLNNATQQLQITTFNAATGTKISAKLEQINLNYYVVFVPNVPDFKQILIEFATTTINTKGEQTLQTISITPKNSQLKDKFVPQTVAFYEQQYVSDLSKDAASQIASIDGKISDLQKQIGQFQDANSRLKTQFDYETTSEQAQTQSEMDNNTSQISALQDQIKSQETAKKSLEDKLKMLESK